MGLAKRSLEASICETGASSSEEEEELQSRTCCVCREARKLDSISSCAECAEALCQDCLQLLPECSGCSRTLCSRQNASDCGSCCVDCSASTCSGCSVKVYKTREISRRCLDCATSRTSRKIQKTRRLLKRSYSVHESWVSPEEVLASVPSRFANTWRSDAVAPSTPVRRVRRHSSSSEAPTPDPVARTSANLPNPVDLKASAKKE